MALSTRPPRVIVAALLGAAGTLAAIAAPGCSSEAPPGARGGAPSATGSLTWGAPPVASSGGAKPVSSVPPERVAALLAAIEDGGVKVDPGTPGEGETWIAIAGVQGNVYSQPSGAKEGRIGYIRRGMKVAGKPKQVKGKNCDEGWYQLVPVGFVCGKVATTDLDNPQVRLGVHEPTLDELLPYKYAHNVAHGTPLYRTVPSAAEMQEYEPYLRKKSDRDADAPDEESKPKRKKKKKKHHDDDGADHAEKTDAEKPEKSEKAEKTERTEKTEKKDELPDGGAPDASDAGLPKSLTLDAGAELADAGVDASEEDDKRPWWQRKYDGGKAPEVKLSDLLEDSDKVLAKRMVKGFYVAVDRTFNLNNRLWHRTTSGLVAPADRMAIVAAPKFSGEEIDEAHKDNAVAFVRSAHATTYEADAKGALKPKGQLARYDRAFLTGKKKDVGERTYRETLAGEWLREADITWTEPGPMPATVKDGERWIDVNLGRQTLVAFEGKRPVYATMVSTGRKGKDKQHDHTTPTGAWRVREKHVATTMDGDGAAAGDLPYSIEDVPFVMYFHESYALHGAFWHDNFGRQQSHGCVNLAPADAKRLFFWSDPQIPKHWHGMFSSEDQKGSLVVVHD